MPTSQELLLKKVLFLKKRAQCLDITRFFFKERNILEVDTPHLSKNASIDPYIDLIQTNDRFLNTSPEYPMKRLLAAGIGDIYQLGHVFREGESGRNHNPEFTLCEWYRIGTTYNQMIDETVEFLKVFLGEHPKVSLTYQEAFLQHTGLDPFLIKDVEERHRLIAFEIEPKFKKDVYTIMTHFPKEEAALAKISGHIAKRFEVYFGGMELANGYHELSHPKEQKDRFEKDNIKRLSLGKKALPIDYFFLEALESGLPDCCGVAVGFDRLLMLKYQKDSIDQVLPFSWNEI